MLEENAGGQINTSMQKKQKNSGVKYGIERI